MYRFFLVIIMIAFTITPALAQETTRHFDFNKDRFMAGSLVVQDTEGVDDLFMVGETVQSQQDITGSAHLVGRKVTSTGDIGGDIYVSAIDAAIEGKVSGDVTIVGYKVQIADVDGDLRASGDKLTLSGPVSGYALVSGDEVRFESVVKGDVSLAADKVDFADTSRIEGTLILYEKDIGETEVPAQVISEDRVERRDESEWSEATKDADSKSWLSRVVSFLRRVLFIAVLAILIAAVRPKKLADLRQNILGQPLRNLLFGFLAISAGIGATILLMFSGLGFLLAVSSLLIALLGAFTGYVVGAYAIGVGLLVLRKRPEPDSLKAQAFAAGVGAFFVSIIALIPYLGWLFAMALALIGAGALFVRLFRRKLSASV